MRVIKWFVVNFLYLCMLAGCAQNDYVADSLSIVKAGDWSKMQTISVSLSEFSFSPSDMTFQTGVPYKLQIQNKGTVKDDAPTVVGGFDGCSVFHSLCYL